MSTPLVIVNKSVNIIIDMYKGNEVRDYMDALTSRLVGRKGLRGEILVELKKSQPSTAKELAERFSVSANAVRRHLKELEAEGLVVYARENRGSGAPTYAYGLSDAGEALFPTQYGEVLSEALRQLAETGGREMVKELFAERFREHAQQIRAELTDASLEQRVKAVAGLLTSQGFMAVWSNQDGAFRLEEHNCSVRAVAEAFPEICDAEQEFLSEVLKSEVRRDSHISEGCNSCQYSIALKPGAAPQGETHGDVEHA